MNSPSICILGGCGHVGLPLGIRLAQAGANVVLVDRDAARAGSVAAGTMPFYDEGCDTALSEVLATGRLTATTDPQPIAAADVLIVTLGTPVDEFLDPQIREFDRSLEETLARMFDGQLLILRSTVFPGVTERLARRVAERGLKIDIAYCPERIAQNHALVELGSLPQIIGGATDGGAERAAEVFRPLGVKLLMIPVIEAELAKLFANAFRYINFAISNQLYLIAQKFGADFNRLHHAATTDYPRLAGFARAGFAGGPCLLKDTMQLAAFNHNDFALGQAAMMVNEGLPAALVAAAKQRYGLRDKTVAILGMAFKGNSDDARNSLSYKLRKVLVLESRRVLCTDPFIHEPDFVTLETALAEADIVFLGACHDEYRSLKLRQPVVDAFGFLPAQADF